MNIYLLPQDIMENTIRAFSIVGDVRDRVRQPRRADRPVPRARERAGLHRDDRQRLRRLRSRAPLVVTGPMYERWDISAAKRTRLVGRTTFEFRADLLNAFNHPNFTPVISTSTNADNYRITGVQENSSRVIQLVARFSW